MIFKLQSSLKFIGKVAIALILFGNQVVAQVYPNGFSEVQLATGVNNPTAMAFAPDGRLFICRKNGEVSIFKNGAINALPFITIATTSAGERGLLGIAFDPDFANNNYVYFYYTLSTGVRNRVSRFTANGDVVVAGSEFVVLDLDPLSTATNHNGGALKFGPDGKLYIGVGDNYLSSNAQNLNTHLGKILRVNPNGSAVADNPYTTGTEQKKRVWAYGLRNPFTFDIQPVTGRLFVNDVGLSNFEEINDATISNRNFGWPNFEGYSNSVGFTSPIYAYGHGNNDSVGCAITAGVFFNPVTTNYPTTYIGKFFYTDYCSDWINIIDFSTPVAKRTTFATGLADNPVALTVGTDGCLYYASRITNSLYKIVYSAVATAPVIISQPKAATLNLSQSINLTIAATGSNPLSYQWLKNNVAIAGATADNYTKNNIVLADSGVYRCVVTNAFGSVNSSVAKISVTNNTPPVAQIIEPVLNASFAGNETINFSGIGTDVQDGNLPATAFSWYLEFHHDLHTHPGPYIQPGISSGSFVIPNTGEVSDNIFYRLFLIVTDANGAVDTDYVDIFPRKSYISLLTNPPGLTVNLDGVPVQTPINVLSVEGVFRNVAPTPLQIFNSTSYLFSSWDDGGAASKTFATPVNDTVFTANYTVSYRFPDNPTSTVSGLYYKYYLGSWSLMPDFNTLTTAKEGTIATFDYSPRTVNDNFGFSFNGYITIPTDSIYTFYTTSDDGSRLYIGNILVVDNDGLHPAQERSASIGLKAGKHIIRVEYFEKTGGQTFSVSWAGPGIPKQIIPAASLSRLSGAISKIVSQDAYVRSGAFGNNTLGQSDATRLYSKYADANSDQARETYLLFDITGFTNEFTSVTVDAYGKLKGADLTSAAEIICVPLTNTFWGESSITFNNRPLTNLPYTNVQYVNSTGGKYFKFDVTSYIRQQINSSNTAVAFVLQGSYSQNNYVLWNSKEQSSNRPRITFNYPVPREVEYATAVFTDKDYFNVFPNPVTDDAVTLAMPSDTKAEVFITDIQGRIVKQLVVNSEFTTISISELNTGMYFVQFVMSDKIVSKKLQVLK